MTTIRLSSSLLIIVLISLMLLPGGKDLFADQAVITDDGREVLLKEDGSWEFRSGDRFANTNDGQRVRLKEDGRWEYMGNAPMVSSAQVRTRGLDVKLDRAVIEIHEVKVQKNRRIKSQTVFYVNLASSPLINNDIEIRKNDVSLIEVKDNKGRHYPVISIQPSPTTLIPGTETSVAVRVDGSPQWWKNVKSMDVVFKPGIFGLQEPITLRQSVDDILKKKVDELAQSQ